MKSSIIKLITLVSLFAILIINSCKIEDNEIQPIDTGTTDDQLIKVTSDFFNDNPGLVDQSDLIIDVTRNFFKLNSNTKEFENKNPLLIKPVYAYGIKGVAYYELSLTGDNKNPSGWLLISATDKDFPIASFSHNGIPYTQSLAENAVRKGITADKGIKIYRFGVSYYTMENEAGQKIAEFGAMPTWIGTDIKISDSGYGDGDSTKGVQHTENNIEPIEGIHYLLIDNYESLKALYAKNYFTAERKNTADVLNHAMKSFTPKPVDRAQYIYRWVSGTQCLYTQIPANTSANYTNCWSGCNNNAWTSLYGWWDKNMGKSALIPTTSTGETCPIYRNTAARRAVVDPVQMYFRSVCSTYCNNGGGWTKWKNAWKGYQYTTAKGYGYSYWYQWCNSAGCDVDLANILTDCIGNNYRPAHVGANSHFYVGHGYAQWDTNTNWTWVYCYPGWSQNHNDDVWISWYDINSSVRVFVY